MTNGFVWFSHLFCVKWGISLPPVTSSTFFYFPPVRGSPAYLLYPGTVSQNFPGLFCDGSCIQLDRHLTCAVETFLMLLFSLLYSLWSALCFTEQRCQPREESHLLTKLNNNPWLHLEEVWLDVCPMFSYFSEQSHRKNSCEISGTMQCFHFPFATSLTGMEKNFRSALSSWFYKPFCTCLN